MKPADPAPASHRDLILKSVAERCGPVEERSITQIVPSNPNLAISIHVVRPSPRSGDSLFLFTTGMSDLPMAIPPGVGNAGKYRHAELVIELPADWRLPIDGFRAGDDSWPIVWLFKIGFYPHHNGAWLGGPFTIYAGEDPPQPVASNSKLSCTLLLADAYLFSGENKERFCRVRCSEDKEVFFYSLLPLYSEERELEKRDGIKALFDLMDKHRVPIKVDLSRVNLASL